MQNRMAGYGSDWQHSHLLARGQVPVPNEMREAVLPGLVGLLLELLSDPSAARLLPTLQALSWLVDVFISDMPLKLRRYGKSWASLFPREVALVTAHPQWTKFSMEVIRTTSPSSAHRRIEISRATQWRHALLRTCHLVTRRDGVAVQACWGSRPCKN